MYERVQSTAIYWKLIFFISVIVFIIFETYWFTGPIFKFENAFPYREFLQKNEKESKLDGRSSNWIEKLHKKENLIINENLFGPLRNDSVIILIQIHNRPMYLRHLIKSLEKATNISDALLIFSHDCNDNDINELIREIHFCKVLQIFYPHSDNNHDGRQVKHHWWWKINYVFDQLNATRFFTGAVMFLEEDHYVSKEFLYILKLMLKESPKLCPFCDAYALGNHLDLDFFDYSKPDHIEVVPWEHNMGFVINRTVWNKIVKCSEVFCTYNDYNWDFTFRYISQNCLPSVISTMVVRRPRVFHIGEWFVLTEDRSFYCEIRENTFHCHIQYLWLHIFHFSGVHIKKSNCDPTPLVMKINMTQQLASENHQMYPKQLKLGYMNLNTQNFNPNGGWNDIRDIDLCMSFNRNNTTNSTNLLKWGASSH